MLTTTTGSCSSRVTSSSMLSAVASISRRLVWEVAQIASADGTAGLFQSTVNAPRRNCCSPTSGSKASLFSHPSASVTTCWEAPQFISNPPSNTSRTGLGVWPELLQGQEFLQGQGFLPGPRTFFRAKALSSHVKLLPCLALLEGPSPTSLPTQECTREMKRVLKQDC